MPAAPAAPPPAAPAAPKGDAAGALPPAQVPASSIALPVGQEPAKPGSYKEAMFKEMEKYAKPAPGEGTAEPPKPPVEPPKPPVEPPKGTQEPPKPPEGATAEPPEPDRTKAKPDKDFWRAFDSWKTRAIKAETDLAESRKGMIPEGDRKTLQDQIDKVQARNKELEEHIYYLDYSKHPEFTTKYQKPYEAALDRAWAEVSQLPVKDAVSGTARQATPQDLDTICMAGPVEAKTLAKEMFGDWADDVLAYRREIRGLLDQRSAALNEAKKNGQTRLQEMSANQQKAITQMQSEIRTYWETANKSALEDPERGQWFKPVEGNTEINSRLEKGFKIVDEAFSLNPADPKLTSEQRKRAVELHAAVRNRAAAFGRLWYENHVLAQKLDAVEKELAGFKKSTPGQNGQPAAPNPAAGAPQSAWARLQAELEKKARPA